MGAVSPAASRATGAVAAAPRVMWAVAIRPPGQRSSHDGRQAGMGLGARPSRREGACHRCRYSNSTLASGLNGLVRMASEYRYG